MFSFETQTEGRVAKSVVELVVVVCDGKRVSVCDLHCSAHYLLEKGTSFLSICLCLLVSSLGWEALEKVELEIGSWKMFFWLNARMCVHMGLFSLLRLPLFCFYPGRYQTSFSLFYSLPLLLPLWSVEVFSLSPSLTFLLEKTDNGLDWEQL